MPRHAEPPRLYLRKDRAGSKVWIIRDRGKDQRTDCLESERERAETRLAEYLAQKHAARPARGGKSDTVSIAEVLRVYAMEHAPTVADPALVARHIENLVPFWGEKMVADIKGASCRAFAAKRTPAMARRSLETLRAAVNYFHKEYGLDPVPAFTMPTKPKRRERWLTRTEAARMLWQARRTPHLARFILIGLYTGTRSGAILGLLWMPSTTGGWIDVDRGVLHRASADKRETKKRQPPAKMPERLLAHARRWKRVDGDMRHVVQWNGAPVASIKKAFRSARSAAGLDAKVIPHSLRHTCATWLMQGGSDIWEAAGFLGMTAEMLERNYGHHSPEFQSGISGAFDRAQIAHRNNRNELKPTGTKRGQIGLVR